MDRVGPIPAIRPRPTLAGRLDAMARAAFPSACTIGLMLAATLPFGVSGQGQLLPAVALGSVWQWSMAYPAKMPPTVVFGIGLLFDLLGSLPLGVGVLTLLIAQAVALRLSVPLASRGFLAAWLAYAAFAAFASALGWAATSLLLLRPMPAGAALFQFAVSGAAYPVIAALLTRAQSSPRDGSA